MKDIISKIVLYVKQEFHNAKGDHHWFHIERVWKTARKIAETELDMRDANGIRLYQFTPSKIIKVSEDEFVFEAYKKKKEDVLVKISLKEG